MGVSTTFFGEVAIVPALGAAERDYLTRFAGTRRVASTLGPYFVDRPGFGGQDHTPDIIDVNRPPDGQPGLWCQWVPTADGAALRWDEGEKFYESAAWMAYLIDHFLRPGAIASSSGDPQFAAFTFDHRGDGRIHAVAQVESAVLDCYRIDVTDNAVTVRDFEVPVLDLDDEWWEVAGDDLDLEWHIERAVLGTDQDRATLAQDLALLTDLGQHEFVAALRAFLIDLGVS